MTNATLEVAIANIISADSTIKAYFPNNTVVIMQEGSITEKSFNDNGTAGDGGTDLIITLRTSGMVPVNKVSSHYTEVAIAQVWKRLGSGDDTYEIREILKRIKDLLHLQPITISGITCLQLKWDGDGPELVSTVITANHQHSKYTAYLVRS